MSLHPPRWVRSAEPGPHCPADLQSYHDHTATCPVCPSRLRLSLLHPWLFVCCPASESTWTLVAPRHAKEASHAGTAAGEEGGGKPPARTQRSPGGGTTGVPVSMSGLGERPDLSHWDIEHGISRRMAHASGEDRRARARRRPWLPPSSPPTATPRGHFPAEGGGARTTGCTNVQKQ